MTREEKQKAIDALKVSAPIMAMTQEKFNDYIQTLNQVMDWLEQEPTTKNDLGVDCIDRPELLKAMDTWDKFGNDPNEGLIPLRTPALQDRYVPYVHYYDMVNCVKDMPSVTPQEPQTFEWCETCKEYDQEKHCCHRWTKVIRNTVEEMKQEQEPKTGHWIRITNGAMKEKYFCSECGRQIEDDGIEGLLPIKYPYCHCGAKMVEPQESEVEDGNKA